MRGLKHWLQHTGITVIFWVAVAILFVLVVCSYTITTTVPAPGEQQTTPLPWLADLCMAYIGAYFFHYLVVVLPGRSKLESRLQTLQTPLTTIAFNGLDMVRELERIAKCPHRRVTEEHLRTVLNRLQFNKYIRTHLSKRMDRTKAAYLAIVPYAADLPLDLQERIQDESQHLAHIAFSLEPEKRVKYVHLSKLREYTLTDLPLEAWLPYILRYYETTEAVRISLEKHMPSTRANLAIERTREPGKKPTMRPGRSSNDFGLYGEPEYPYWTYPPSRGNTAKEDEDKPAEPEKNEPKDVEGKPAAPEKNEPEGDENKPAEPEGDDASKEPVNK